MNAQKFCPTSKRQYALKKKTKQAKIVMEIQNHLTFDNNDIEFLSSRWHLSWKGHILSVSRKISKSIDIIYKSSLCPLYLLFYHSRPFLIPLVNILCFSKSHNGFSSSDVARAGFQRFRLYFKQKRKSCAISKDTVSLL